MGIRHTRRWGHDPISKTEWCSVDEEKVKKSFIDSVKEHNTTTRNVVSSNGASDGIKSWLLSVFWLGSFVPMTSFANQPSLGLFLVQVTPRKAKQQTKQTKSNPACFSYSYNKPHTAEIRWTRRLDLGEWQTCLEKYGIRMDFSFLKLFLIALRANWFQQTLL